MPNAREPAGGRPRLSALIAFALREGWKVSRPSGRCIVLSKAGMPPIFSGLPCNGGGAAESQRRGSDAVLPGSDEGVGHA